jgi:CheY-like chemotaxis protein
MNNYSDNLSDKQNFILRPLILIVDDHEDNLLFMSHILEFLKFNYIKTNSGQELLKLAKQYLPNLILLDIVMPEIDGIELAYRHKKDLITSSIPLIAITGLVHEEQKVRINKAGFNDYLSKPFFIADLETIINRYLN